MIWHHAEILWSPSNPNSRLDWISKKNSIVKTLKSGTKRIRGGIHWQNQGRTKGCSYLLDPLKKLYLPPLIGIDPNGPHELNRTSTICGVLLPVGPLNFYHVKKLSGWQLHLSLWGCTRYGIVCHCWLKRSLLYFVQETYLPHPLDHKVHSFCASQCVSHVPKQWLLKRPINDQQLVLIGSIV